MISVEELTVEFGGFVLLNAISFQVNRNDRIALVGRNGAGKSTLLKIMAGQQMPTSGRLDQSKALTVGYLPQEMRLIDKQTVREEVESAFQSILACEQEVERLQQEMASRSDYSSDAYQRLMEEFSLKSERLALSDIRNYQAAIEKTLLGLGFERKDFDRPTSEFSGGWRMRIELAKLLLQSPDVMLLDEPTNHLDMESIQWLESFISRQSNAVVVVSHDKAFINAVSNRTIELSQGRLYDYKVPYGAYLTLRKEQVEQQRRAYENQQKMIEETERFIERFRYKATKAVQVQSRIKQLEKLDRIKVDETDQSAIHLRFPPSPRSGTFPLLIDHVSKQYDDHLVLHGASLSLRRGEKVAFVGKNGAGKTTLVRCILGEIPYEGQITIGHQVKIGYFAQNQASLLDGNLTVFETIDQVATGPVRTSIRDILGAFLFGGEISERQVKFLSGGEKSRLAMIRLLLDPVNLLILDEPTNHLDIPTKDVLKNALQAFDGTAIIVSHDREFLDGLVTRVFEFGDGSIKEYPGDIHYYLQQKKWTTLLELDQPLKGPDVSAVKPPSPNKEQYESRKVFQKEIKRLEAKIEELEQLIQEKEKAIQQLEMDLSKPDTDHTVAIQHYQSLKDEISLLMSAWEETSLQLDNWLSKSMAE